MTAVVCIPFSSADPVRLERLASVRSWWESHGFAVVVGDRPPPRQCGAGWSKGTHAMAAVREALFEHGAEVVIVADGDVVPELESTRLMVQEVERRRAWWALPTSRVVRLTEAGTRVALTVGLDHATLGVPNAELIERRYRQHAGGGLTVIAAGAYVEVPIDPRFTGWGQEDDAWGRALGTMLGPPARRQGQLLHLWHPPAVPPGTMYGSPYNVELFNRYYAARSSQSVMSGLLCEARAALGVLT